MDKIGNNKELRSFFHEFFGEDETNRILLFWDGLEKRHTIRVNTLKISRDEVVKRLTEKGFKLKSLDFYEDAFLVKEAPYEIGKTLEHYLGYFYVQSTSSMLPPLVLKPQPHEKVLDLAAAPGSKTTQMAQMMNNTGFILANDVDYDRIKALSNNVDRLGALNVIITMTEGHRIAFMYPETFDRVLIDAPCSALGTMYKSDEIRKWWSYEKIKRLRRVQKGLILAGFRALKKGGEMVYSTCTFVPEENEKVVDFLLKREKNADLLDIEFEWYEGFQNGLVEYRDDRFDDRLEKTLRVMPSEIFHEGFYIARIKKV